MLTCTIADTISIELEKGLDDVHFFRITAYSESDSYQVSPPSTVSIYEGSTLLLLGKATAYSYDYQTKIITITGQDATSYKYSYDDHESTCPADETTHIQQALNAHTSGLCTSANPNLPCYGYGSYSGDSHPLVERVCNSFGLNYYSCPTSESGYTLTDGNITTPAWASCTQYLCLSLSNDKQSTRAISKVYIQKPCTQDSAQQVTIENAGHSTSSTVSLCNPNASESGYPADVWIDPWTKCLVNIKIPATYSIYDQATSVGEVKRVTVLSCTDSQAEPAWYLQCWQGDPGTVDVPSAGSVLLGTVSVGQTWEAGASETCTYVRIARTLIYETGSSQTTATDYPHYEGVAMGIKTYATASAQDIEAWSDSFESGDEGRVDHNVISEEMYPDYDVFVGAGMGERICRRDSIVHDKSLIVPQFPSIAPKAGAGVIVEGIQHPIPAYRWTHTASPGIQQTEIKGEW